MSKAKSKILKGAGVLAVFSLIAKMIGALYRIPLTNVVGAEGIGLYHMVFPLYTVLLTVSSGGLPVAISKVVATRTAKGDETGARQVLFVSLISLLIAGTVAAALVVVFKDVIAAVQGNPKAAFPYLGIAPSVIFVAVIASFRGYFQGKQNMLPSAISQVTEQIIKLFAGLTLARLFLNYSVEMAVLGALLGVSASEFITMIILIGIFLFSDRKYKHKRKVNSLKLNFEAAAENSLNGGIYKPARTKEILKEVYKIAIPVTLGSLVMPITQLIDSVLVINLLTSGGTDVTTATSLFGLVTGPINSLINMPVVVTLSMATALLPQVSQCFSRGESYCESVEDSLKYNFIIGLLGTLILGVFSYPILSILYRRGLTAQQIETGAKLLSIGSLSVLYVSMLQVATSVLQAVGKPHRPALNLLFGAVLKVLATLFLLPLLGITGAMAGTVLCYGLTCLLDIISMRKFAKFKLSFRQFFVAPCLSGGVYVASALVLKAVLSRFLAPTYALITAFVVSLVLFCVCLMLFGALNRDELSSLPIVGKFIKKVYQKRDCKKSKQDIEHDKNSGENKPCSCEKSNDKTDN